MGKKAKKNLEQHLAAARHRAAVNDTVPCADRGNPSPLLLTPVPSPVDGVKRAVSAMACVRVMNSPHHGQGLFATAPIRAGTDLLLKFELFPSEEIAWRYQLLKLEGMISGHHDLQVPLIVHILMLPECERDMILAYYDSCDALAVPPLITEQVRMPSTRVQHVREYVGRSQICSAV